MKEWIIGRNPVFEVLRASRRDIFRLWIAEGAEVRGTLSQIIHLAEKRKFLIERAPRSRLDALGENPQGVAIEVSQYPYCELPDILVNAVNRAEDPLILLLDLIQNPQNLGTLLRTAEAVGVSGVVLPLRQAAGVTPAVVHASAGATEHLMIAQANLAHTIATLKEANCWIIGLDQGPQAQDLFEINLKGGIGIVVGNEGEGLRHLVRQSCDIIARMPMRGQIESLNAAVAGSIALYQVLAARQGKG